MSKIIVQHSIPAWIRGPKARNPKFNPGAVGLGLPLVADRLQKIAGLSQRLTTRDKQPLLTSLHLFNEVGTTNPKYADCNSPNAIAWDTLLSMLQDGSSPHICALTAPAFGRDDVIRGAILSPDAAVAERAYAAHSEVIEKAALLKQKGLGMGVVIWWPAWDSRNSNILGWTPLPFEEAWAKLRAFWVKLLKETGAVVHLEWKPEDPGMDYIATLELAIQFCREVNDELGRTALVINNEWAHLLIGGMTVEDGTQETIDAGLFTGFLHANSSKLLFNPITDIMQQAAGCDYDWAVGMGGKERWYDQQAAVKILLESDVERLLIEHDIDPAGNNPDEYAALSIGNFEKMMAA